MYTAHFGLNSAPFSITPDPHYLYLSSRHREALAHLLYGVNEGPGFVLLTGEVGTGKTTLCHCLIEQLPENVDVALLLNPRLSPLELLATLFDELRISYDETYTLKDFIDILHSYLLTAQAVGRRTVLILDEAQNLTVDVLEQVRLLTNLETTSHKLLQIILVGQPELKTLLKQSNLRQLAQRITARCHLLPLPPKETQGYIAHRLTISGAQAPLFTKAAMKLVHRYSGGIPRLINIFCDRALLGGYVSNQHSIDPKIVRQAAQEVRGEREHWRPARIFFKLTLIIVGGSFLGWWWWQSPTTFPSLPSFSQETPSLQAASPVTQPARPVPIPSAKPNLLNLLQDPQIPKDLETAFVTLFRQWQADYPQLAGNTACDRAALKGLACLPKVGSWEDLRRLNRPAILELVGDNGAQYHGVLTHLQDNLASLNLGDKIFEFSINDINQFWLGRFFLLWHPPQIPIPVIKVGITNEAVRWIRKHLAIKEGNSQVTWSATFDQTLRRRLIALQQHYGLGADGVAGAETMLILQAFDPEGPLLKPINATSSP